MSRGKEGLVTEAILFDLRYMTFNLARTDLGKNY